MVGPDMNGRGGVSQVVRIWRDAGFFDGFRVAYVSSASDTSRFKMLTLLKGLIRLLFALPGGGSLVYVHSSAYKSFYRKSLFVLLAVLFRKKILLHIHPSGFSNFQDELSGIARRYVDFVLGKVDTFVLLTEGMLRHIGKRFPGKPSYVLRNAVDLRKFPKGEATGRGNPDILYLGWFIRAKGVYELVDAVGILLEKGRRVRLDFYGTKEAEALRSYVKKKCLDGPVMVNGWIDDEEKVRMLHAATMLVLPSHTEGIPNVILEAMATGTPIIATFVGGMREILRDGENSVISKAEDPVDLAEKISFLLDQAEQRNRMAGTAYREVLDKYDVQVIRGQFRRILKEATG